MVNIRLLWKWLQVPNGKSNVLCYSNHHWALKTASIDKILIGKKLKTYITVKNIYTFFYKSEVKQKYKVIYS